MKIKLVLTLLIPLIYLAFFPLVLTLSGSPGFGKSEIVYGSIVLTYLGIFLWFGGLLSLGGSFGVLPQRQPRVRRGLYRFISHPIYWGIFLTFLGIGFSLGSVWGVLYDLLVIGLTSYFRAKKEEGILQN